ncbi:MAG TPA: adenylyl-sulfate kinase [Candidatus Latescibacteria bacterium]|nr:adenylyl-sulfate kinase [Candidatus Latescibacterota bacterium]
MAQKADHIRWHEGNVDRPRREALLAQQGVVLWFTGLSGSGKSTIAFAVEHALTERGRLAYVLDGDNIRHGLNNNLGFSATDRTENIRRIGEVSRLFADAGLITLSSFVSPYRSDRDKVRTLLDEGDFVEIFVNTPLALCEQRDPKGLYKKARSGEIPNFTGISDPYEPPTTPELEIHTAELTVEAAASLVLDLLEQRGKIATA